MAQKFTAAQIKKQQEAVEGLHKAYNTYMSDVSKGDAERDKALAAYKAGLGKLSAMLGTTTKEYQKQNIQINASVGLMHQLAKNAKLMNAQGKLTQGYFKSMTVEAKMATRNDVKRQALAEKVAAAAKRHVQENGKLSEYGKGIVERAQSAYEVADRQQQVYSDIADTHEEVLRNADMLGERELESIDTRRAEQSLMDAELTFQANKAKMTKADIAFAQRRIKAQRQRLELLQMEAVATDKIIQKSEAATNAVMAPFEAAKGFVESLPGGKFLSQAFGLDAFGQTLGDITKKSMQVAFKKGPKAGIAHFKGLASQAKAFGAMLSGPQIAIIAIVALLAAAVMSFMKMAKQAKEFAKETGASYLQSKALVKEAYNAQTSYRNQLSTVQDILEVNKQIIKEFGPMAAVSGKTAANLSDMGKAFGYGAETAGQVQAAFMGMGLDANEAMELQGEIVKDALIAGVDMSGVMKDIAANGAKANKFIKGGAKEMAKAAVEAAKMGATLDDIANVGEALLDIESSITGQMKFQALSGKAIAGDEIRRLNEMGKTQEAMELAADSFKSMEEIDAMSPRELKYFEQATGMSEEMLRKAQVMKDLRGKMNEDDLAAVSKLGLSAAEMQNMSITDLKNRAAAANQTEQMAAKVEKLKNGFIEAFAPIGEMLIDTVLPMLDTMKTTMEPIISILSAALKVIMMVVKPLLFITNIINKIIGLVVKGLLMPFEILVGIVTGVYDIFVDFFNEIFGEGPGIMGMFDAIGDAMSFIGDLIVKVLLTPLKFLMKAILIPIKYAFMAIKQVVMAVWEYGIKPIWEGMKMLFNTIIQPFKDAWDSISETISGIFGGGPLEEGSKTLGFMEKVAKSIGKVFEFIGAVIQVAFMILSKMIKIALLPAKIMFEGIKFVVMGIWEAIKMLGDGIKTVFNAVLSIIKAPFNLLIAGANAIIGGLNSISVTIPDWVPIVGGKTFGFSIPEIPSFDTGGVVAETGIATVHAGETITPAEKVPGTEGGAAGGGGGADMSGVISVLNQILSKIGTPPEVTLDGQKISRMVATDNTMK